MDILGISIVGLTRDHWFKHDLSAVRSPANVLVLPRYRLLVSHYAWQFNDWGDHWLTVAWSILVPFSATRVSLALVLPQDLSFTHQTTLAGSGCSDRPKRRTRRTSLAGITWILKHCSRFEKSCMASTGLGSTGLGSGRLQVGVDRPSYLFNEIRVCVCVCVCE